MPAKFVASVILDVLTTQYVPAPVLLKVLVGESGNSPFQLSMIIRLKMYSFTFIYYFGMIYFTLAPGRHTLHRKQECIFILFVKCQAAHDLFQGSPNLRRHCLPWNAGLTIRMHNAYLNLLHLFAFYVSRTIHWQACSIIVIAFPSSVLLGMITLETLGSQSLR